MTDVNGIHPPSLVPPVSDVAYLQAIARTFFCYNVYKDGLHVL